VTLLQHAKGSFAVVGKKVNVKAYCVFFLVIL